MRKHIKLFVFLGTLISVFIIYNIFKDENAKINYIALGDSIAEGINSYGSLGYGYPDYIGDYLKKEERLTFYTKDFAKSGYTIEDVSNDIENSKTIIINNEKLNIKEALRESDLVTISIGANDFIKDLSILDFYTKFENMSQAKKEVDKIGIELKKLMILIKKYAKNQIILVGYYNPLPRMETLKADIDELVKYSNNMYEEICDELSITYVDIFEEFNGNKRYLPNPLDIHPNIEGYEVIAKKIIDKIE